MTLSLNALAAPLAASLCADAERLRLKVSGGQDAPVLVDAGIDCLGGIEAGRRVAEICLGGLGRVRVEASGDGWPLALTVTSSQPALACLASQYAGWGLSHGEGKQAWFSLGSGPVRALTGKEELFAELGYADRHDSSVLDPAHDLPQGLLRASAAMGTPAAVDAMTASGDAWFYNNQLGIPTVVYGPGTLKVAHSKDEQIALADMAASAATLVRFIMDYCGGKR